MVDRSVGQHHWQPQPLLLGMATPFGLQRFIEAQDPIYEDVRAELV
jgi:hypothetical protein